MFRHTLLRVFALACVSTAAAAADFFIDPVNGSASGNGSSGDPWQTLQQVIEDDLVETRDWDVHPYGPGANLVVKNPGAPVKAGDTLWLLSGYHGDVSITGAYNGDWITVAAAPGNQPQLRHMVLRAAEKWHLSGLVVSASFGGPLEQISLLELRAHDYHGPMYDIVVSDCELYSVNDASGWNAASWDTLASNGIVVTGDDVVVRDNRLRNVNFGISVSGASCLIARNTVENFSGDGIRGLGDYGTYEYNVVRNSYDVNDNHDDGFQSWSIGPDGQVGTGTVYGVTLRGNIFVNCTDLDQPYCSQMQGIGCFDGMFEDWVVENNLIVTDHWHGITLAGCVNCRIVNNTAVDRLAGNAPVPWIRFSNHKNGTPSTGCVMRNNLTPSINNDPQGSVTVDHNLVYSDPADHFIAPPPSDTLNLRLLDTSTAINNGSAIQAPSMDADGVPRPQEGEFDIGAYEWNLMLFYDGFEARWRDSWSVVVP
jgi:hypothetical protein